MFFNSWTSLLRTVIVGILAYVGLVFALRVSGKRTLSKMNAFDLVVTVALGSTLATILLSKDVALAEGLLAFLVLICLQYAVAWLSVRSRKFQQLVKARPTLLFYEGQFLQDALDSRACGGGRGARGSTQPGSRLAGRGRGGGARDRRHLHNPAPVGVWRAVGSQGRTRLQGTGRELRRARPASAG